MRTGQAGMTDEVQDRDCATVDPRLLEILICPLTRQKLSYDRARNELLSPKARLAYRLSGGIAVMLPEEARDLEAPDPDRPEAPE